VEQEHPAALPVLRLAVAVAVVAVVKPLAALQAMAAEPVQPQQPQLLAQQTLVAVAAAAMDKTPLATVVQVLSSCQCLLEPQ
jgi:hypothetical protein